MSLSGKQQRHLRSLGHHLQALVQIGKQGVTEGVISAADEAITSHELIKVRRSSDCPQTRKQVATALAAALAADVVQQLGHTVLLYRAHPDEPVIVLPRG